MDWKRGGGGERLGGGEEQNTDHRKERAREGGREGETFPIILLLSPSQLSFFAPSNISFEKEKCADEPRGRVTTGELEPLCCL